jgi:hypothetical protein
MLLLGNKLQIIMPDLILFLQGLVITEAIATIAGFSNLHKLKDSYLKWVPIYLAIITLLEIGYHLCSYFHKSNAASYIYIVSILIEMFFINWLFYKIFKSRYKKLILTGVIFYVISLLLEKTILSSTTYYFQSLSYTIGNLFILIYIILYFVQLVNSDKILVFKKLTEFWIACGMLVFYLGTFPFYGLYNELAKNIDIFMAVAWVATSLNYCMYLLFTIGFIWGKAH